MQLRAFGGSGIERGVSVNYGATVATVIHDGDRTSAAADQEHGNEQSGEAAAHMEVPDRGHISPWPTQR